MALTVNTNISSLNAQYTLTQKTKDLSRTTEHLSLGYRINSAKDDPANLQISNRFTSQISSKYMGNKNSNDGIALAQTIDGALEESVNLLQKIRTLAVQSANGVYNATDREAMQGEVTECCREITTIAERTKFGGAEILLGAGHGLIDADGMLTLQVSSGSGDTIRVDLSNSYRLTDLRKACGDVPADGAGYDEDNNVFDVSTQDNANAVLAHIDAYIQVVDAARGELGASMKRLESHIVNQSNVIQNETDTRSRMRDADFAKESADLISSQIMSNASSQMLMQANQTPNFVLALLQD